MKTIINRNSLLNALSLAAQVADRSGGNPILGCVRLTASTDKGGAVVEIAATSLDKSVLIDLADVQIEECGVACIDAQKLRTVVGAFDNDDVLSVNTNASGCVVASRLGKAELFTMNPIDFPPLHTDKAEVVVTIRADEFRRGVSATAKIPKNASGRFAMNGVYLRRDGAMVATDTHRLVLVGKIDGPKDGAVVPPDAMMIAAKLDGDEIEIGFSESFVSFESCGTRIAATLLAGQFPPYAEVIPPETAADSVVLASADSLAGLVRRGSLACGAEVDKDGKDAGRSPVLLAFDAGELKVSATHALNGKSSDAMPIKLDGKPISIGMNPTYVLDLIRSCGSEEVKLSLTTPTRPMRVDGGGVIGVLMPRRI